MGSILFYVAAGMEKVSLGLPRAVKNICRVFGSVEFIIAD